MGEWYYYVTYMKFEDVASWIKATTEVHKSEKLSEWIQRRLVESHAEGIANYLVTEPQRFFNALVIGVYGGRPQWAGLRVHSLEDSKLFELSEDQEIELEASVGLLALSGREKLFAIDGQHRVAGIKQAIAIKPELNQDEICAIFVGHETTAEGMARTRRLFTTLNKTARKVSTADIVALDEDNAFAVVTRMLVDDFALFRRGEMIAFVPTPAIPVNDMNSVTSILSLYQQCKDLYDPNQIIGAPKKKEVVMYARPSEDVIQQLFAFLCNYWTTVVKTVPEMRRVFDRRTKQVSGEFRKKNRNHLLFRPIGQRAFAGAVHVLMQRGWDLESAVKGVASVDLWIHHQKWHHILWDPVHERMEKSHVAAESFLLRLLKQPARSEARETALDEILEGRE